MDGVDDAMSSRMSARLLWVGASREVSKEEVLKDGLSFRCWEERRNGLGTGCGVNRGWEAGTSKVCPREHPSCALVA